MAAPVKPNRYAPYPKPPVRQSRATQTPADRVSLVRKGSPQLILHRHQIQKPHTASGTMPVTVPAPPDAAHHPAVAITAASNTATLNVVRPSVSKHAISKTPEKTLGNNQKLHDLFIDGYYHSFNASIIKYLTDNPYSFIREGELVCENTYKDNPACMAFVHLVRGLKSLHPEIHHLQQLLLHPVQFIRSNIELQSPDQTTKLLKSLQAATLLLTAHLYKNTLLGKKSQKLLLPAPITAPPTEADDKYMSIPQTCKMNQCFVILNIYYTEACQAVSALLSICEVLGDAAEGSFTGIFPEDFPADYFVKLKRRHGIAQRISLHTANLLIRQTLLNDIRPETLLSMIQALADNTLGQFERTLQGMVQVFRSYASEGRTSPNKEASPNGSSSDS